MGSKRTFIWNKNKTKYYNKKNTNDDDDDDDNNDDDNENDDNDDEDNIMEKKGKYLYNNCLVNKHLFDKPVADIESLSCFNQSIVASFSHMRPLVYKHIHTKRENTEK